MSIIWRRRPLLIAAVSVVVGVATCGWYFGSQLEAYADVRGSAEWKWCYAVPGSLQNAPAFETGSTVISGFGYRFEAPWTGITHESGDGTYLLVKFGSGPEISFLNPQVYPGHRLIPGVPSGSRYAHIEAVLATTPDDVCPISSHQRFENALSRIEEKMAFLGHEGPFDVRTFQSTVYRGFEVRGVAGSTILSIFDSADNVYRISLQPGARANPEITQAEVNRVIRTFAPIPSAPGKREQE